MGKGMKVWHYKKIMVVIFISLTVLMCSFPIPINASNSTTLNVEPSSIINPSISPGDTFEINITITDVTDLFGCQVKLGFSPGVLECTKASLPSNHIFAGKIYSAPQPVIDNTAGYVVVMVILMGVQPGVNVTKGIFYKVTFKNKARGTSSIEFLDVNKTTYMINSQGKKISFTPNNGYFNNRLPVPTAFLSMNPSRVVNPQLTPCNNFTVNVTILQATDLQKWQLSIIYNKNILNVVNVIEGQFLRNAGSTAFNFEIQNNFNETHGRVTAICSLETSGVTGNGTLVSLIFHVISLGNTTLSFDEVFLFDSTSYPIPYSKFDGYFNNMLVPKLHVVPEKVVGPQWLPGTNFTITVTVESIENLYAYEFKLKYDSAVLICFGMIVHSPFDETRYITHFSVNNSVGEAWVRTQYYTPAKPLTTYLNASLVTLFFRVRRIGKSELQLTDTHLIDVEGNKLTHEFTDGYFATLVVDAAVISATLYPNKVYQGWLVFINITFFNDGNLTLSFEFKVYCDNLIINRSTINGLMPGEVRVVTLAWNTTNMSPYYDYNYTVKVEIPPLQYEVDVADNTLCDGRILIKMPGDVNGDGIVELTDFLIVSDAFGSYPGHSRWNPDCDFNQDGIIELLDFLILSQNFAKTYPPHP